VEAAGKFAAKNSFQTRCSRVPEIDTAFIVPPLHLSQR
jgi:hypothetical protein